MALEQDGMPFVLCPKQGSKVEVFALNNVYGTRTLEIGCTVQYRKWSPTANDPETANDPQNGPKMILDRKWSPKLTANDHERKIGRAWTHVSGSSCKFYYYYKKSDYKLNFTSQINTRIKPKWKKSFISSVKTRSVGNTRLLPHAKMLLLPMNFFSGGWIIPLRKRFDWANVIFAAYFILRGHDTHFLRLLLFLVRMICPLM